MFLFLFSIWLVVIVISVLLAVIALQLLSILICGYVRTAKESSKSCPCTLLCLVIVLQYIWFIVNFLFNMKPSRVVAYKFKLHFLQSFSFTIFMAWFSYMEPVWKHFLSFIEGNARVLHWLLKSSFGLNWANSVCS